MIHSLDTHLYKYIHKFSPQGALSILSLHHLNTIVVGWVPTPWSRLVPTVTTSLSVVPVGSSSRRAGVLSWGFPAKVLLPGNLARMASTICRCLHRHRLVSMAVATIEPTTAPSDDPLPLSGPDPHLLSQLQHSQGGGAGNGSVLRVLPGVPDVL
jgi:hypothetical protein